MAPYTYAQLPLGAPVSTAQRIKFLVTVDAGPTATDTLPNATLVAMMRPGPLKDAWSKTYATQAAARAALAEGVSGVITAGDVKLYPRAVASCSWGVDVGVDGGLLPTLVFIANVAVAEAICEVSMKYSKAQ